MTASALAARDLAGALAVAEPFAAMLSPLGWLLLLTLAAAPVAALLGRRAGPTWSWSVGLAVLLACWLPLLAMGQSPASVTLGAVTLAADGLAILTIALTVGLATLALLADGHRLRTAPGGATHVALVLAAVGSGAGLVSAGDLFTLWIWFEALALVSYGLVCLDREQPPTLAATLLYLVQGAAGSMLALVGIALVLGQTGTLDLGQIRASATLAPSLLAAGALMLVGFGVKAALVPLHTWLPDVYGRAPGGAVALLAGAVTKLGLIALLRALASLAGLTPTWGVILLAAGVLQIATGNLLAFRQTDVRRLLACSSLAHLGYIVLGVGIGVYAGEVGAIQGGLFHFLTHGLMVALAFLAVEALAGAAGDGQPLIRSELAGSIQRRPLAAAGLAVGVLGLGGLPPLAGFMSEWQIFAAGVATRDPLVLGLVVFAVANVVLSLAYYTPLVTAVFQNRAAGAAGAIPLRPAGTPVGSRAPLVILLGAVLLLGVWPTLVQGLTAPAGAALFSLFRT